jgi:hypothetical protein
LDSQDTVPHVGERLDRVLEPPAKIGARTAKTTKADGWADVGVTHGERARGCSGLALRDSGLCGYGYTRERYQYP